MPEFYRRYLPHWHPPGAQFFITFRLAGSLPRKVLQHIEEELAAYRRQGESQHPQTEEARRRFRLYERWLEQYRHGPTWLERPVIAGVVRAEIHRLDGERYTLLAYCIMPNHVHLLIDMAGYPLGEEQPEGGKRGDFLSETMRLLKGRSARFANQYLHRQGRFWWPESYDHVVRDEQALLRITRYIAQNPVKAGLVNHWEHWPFTWVRPPLAEASGLLQPE